MKDTEALSYTSYISIKALFYRLCDAYSYRFNSLRQAFFIHFIMMQFTDLPLL